MAFCIHWNNKKKFIEIVLVCVLGKVDTKMGLDLQDIYWGKCLNSKRRKPEEASQPAGLVPTGSLERGVGRKKFTGQCNFTKDLARLPGSP